MEIGSAVSNTLTQKRRDRGPLGGDEFTVLLNDATIEGDRTCAERLRQAIASTRGEFALEDVQVTAPLGVASTSKEAYETASNSSTNRTRGPAAPRGPAH